MQQWLGNEAVAVHRVAESRQAVRGPRPQRVGAKRCVSRLELLLAVPEGRAQRGERIAYVLVGGDERLRRRRDAVRFGAATPDAVGAGEHELRGGVFEVGEIRARCGLERGERLLECAQRG